MELRQLRYFLRVASELHFGRAAERLNVAPSAVSQQVARLERELGVQLLDRSRRTVRLTEAGERFVPLAQNVIDALRTAVEQMRDLSDEQQRVVRLGTSAGLGARISDLAERAQRADPPVELRLEYLRTADRLAAVLAGELDAAIVRGDSRATGRFDFTEVWQDELLVALPSVHPLAGEHVVDLAGLADLPLRISPRDDNPDLYDAVQQAAHAAGFTPRIVGDFGGSLHEGFARLAIGAPSWTVFFASHAKTLAIPGISFLPANVGAQHRPLRLPAYLVTDAGRRLTPALVELLQICRESA
ncbi:LysR family transcriptional regulator [Tsukamurella sp. 8F]|uniref:LysR family transcriptional regulator n=1 Tax=unclassified Tsukamurella TaxID=2633480 RepID=UPI0023B9FABA|nr:MULTISPECIES: LysR family transcriptional regulator [unclassified Tsukamurella]MDF0529360.1 LysR family transcriptional regulator [Tsukamurella sp. 8J]MDF0587133.1 LysR family transcriptional regulator [Tsukamurella sp. 8F]